MQNFCIKGIRAQRASDSTDGTRCKSIQEAKNITEFLEVLRWQKRKDDYAIWSGEINNRFWDTKYVKPCVTPPLSSITMASSPKQPRSFDSFDFKSKHVLKLIKKKLIPFKYSCEEVDERRANGLCVFCEEQETIDHHLQHKNLRLVMFGDDTDPVSDVDRVLGTKLSIDEIGVKKVTATIAEPDEETDQKKTMLQENSQEAEPKSVAKQIKIEEIFDSVQKNESQEANESSTVTYSIPQPQVSNSIWEPSLRCSDSSRFVLEDLPYVVMRRDVYRSGFESIIGKVNASQVFDTMTMREQKLQQIRKWNSPPKTWRFKFKISLEKDKITSAYEMFKGLCTRPVCLNRILCTQTSLETFLDVLTFASLRELISSSSVEELSCGIDSSESALFIVRLGSIPVFGVYNSKETEDRSYDGIVQHVKPDRNSLTASFELLGHIIEKCLQLRDLPSSYFFPGVLVFVEWLACCPVIARGRDPNSFWNQCVALFNQILSLEYTTIDDVDEETCFSNMSMYDERETENQLALWEDHELRGFLTLLPAHTILNLLRKNSFGTEGPKEKKAHIKRVLAAGKVLTSVIKTDHGHVYFDSKKFLVGVKSFDESLDSHSSLVEAENVRGDNQAMMNLNSQVMQHSHQIYLEAQGHCLLFLESVLTWLVSKQEDLSAIPQCDNLEEHKTVFRLVAVSNLIYQAAGDILSGLFLVEVIMHHKRWSIQKWNEWKIMLMKKRKHGKDWGFKYKQRKVTLLLQQTPNLRNFVGTTDYSNQRLPTSKRLLIEKNHMECQRSFSSRP